MTWRTRTISKKKMTKINNFEDPWKLLSPPVQITDVNGRRVDAKLRYDLYWAVDVDNNCLLILQHNQDSNPKNKLPKLRGLEVEVRPQGENRSFLMIRLKDNEQREIFHRLCLDIIDATRSAQSESEAVERFLGRTWRWHRLLRGGRSGKLSEEEQKGLIGELLLMQRHLFASIGIEAAVKSWTGPLNAPKDFEIGGICIEAKSRRAGATPYIAVSTQNQLDTDGIESLFLHVVDITAARADDPKGFTVTEISREIYEEVRKRSTPFSDIFEERLFATGFDWQHNYSDQKWLSVSERLFKVEGGFPRITPKMCPSGVADVKYTVALAECESFRSDYQQMAATLKGEENGNQS